MSVNVCLSIHQNTSKAPLGLALINTSSILLSSCFICHMRISFFLFLHEINRKNANKNLNCSELSSSNSSKARDNSNNSMFVSEIQEKFVENQKY